MADPTLRIYWQVLVVRCQAGDQAAFAELVARCQPRLRAFLFKMLRQAQIVDDLAQDVWMDVFRDLRTLIDPAAFLPWFYRIAHNRAYRVLRKRREPIGSVETDQLVAESETEPEFTPEEAAAVHAAMDKLSNELREVLLLRFMEEMSYEDIARVVECPVGTVRSRIHNAKRELRKQLQPLKG
jgi:RNA polymerase sigma-70 factor (ECF subfamily)